MISNNLVSGAWFLDGVRNLQERLTRTQKQISSGFRIQDAADSPGEAASVIGLGTAVSSVEHYLTNLGRVSAETSGADTALSSAITLIERARQLAVQGANSTTTAAARQGLAIEVGNIQQQIVALANSSVEGRYVFGGDQDQSPPYQLNSAATRGVDKLTVQTNSRTFQDPAGLPVYSGESAAAIFDAEDSSGNPASDNVFTALQGLATALNANDQAGTATALTQLRAGSDWLNQKQAGYGASARRLADETTQANNILTSLRTRLSEIRETDIVQAATDLTLETTAQSAAFSAQASVPRKSLFDYLG